MPANLRTECCPEKLFGSLSSSPLFLKGVTRRSNTDEGLQRNVKENDIDIGWDIKTNGLEWTELIFAYP